MYNDTVLNSTKYKHTLQKAIHGSMVEQRINKIPQSQYITKDHIVTHMYIGWQNCFELKISVLARYSTCFILHTYIAS